MFPASSRRKKLGDPVKLIIDNRYQAIQRRRVVLGPLDQETGDFFGVSFRGAVPSRTSVSRADDYSLDDAQSTTARQSTRAERLGL